jgi:hypothetical protein
MKPTFGFLKEFGGTSYWLSLFVVIMNLRLFCEIIIIIIIIIIKKLISHFLFVSSHLQCHIAFHTTNDND